MTMTKVGAAAPSGSQTTTTFQLGTYNQVTDTFTQVLDLNDQATYYLKPGKGGAPNPKFAQKSTAVRADNVRSDGSLVVKDHLDNITGTAIFTIKATTPQGVSDAWNAVVKLIKGRQASRGGALCLRFAWPQSSAYSYLDIQYASVTTPIGSPLEIQAKASTGLVIAFEGGPAWRWDRLMYQNLAWNPGFEAPSGPGTPVFADAFATTNAYVVQSGGVPSVGTASAVYSTVITGDSPYLYYRLADTTTTATDVQGHNNGTLHGTYTQGQVGALAADANTATAFNGSTGYISAAATGLHTANTAWSIEGWVNPAAYPSGNASLVQFGTNATKSGPLLYMTNGGTVLATGTAWGDTGTFVAPLNTWTYLAVTWDGTTLRCYANGAASGSPTTPGAMTVGSTAVSIGAGIAGAAGSFFNGRIDEVAIYNSALSAGQVLAHYNAGLANAMTIPNGGQVSFGSPAWGAVNQWQLRFRYLPSQTATYFLHYTNASNYLSVVTTGSSLVINHSIAGTIHAIATAAPTLTASNWYWLQVTQFPRRPLTTAYVTANLYNDNAGAIGSAVGSGNVAAFTADIVVALVGKPQIAVSGAALTLGGNTGGSGNAVTLFGPGAWGCISQINSATCASAGAWDGALVDLGMSGSGTMYTGGDVTSQGAARLDLGPAGTVDSLWYLYNATNLTISPTGQWVLPISVTPTTLEFSAQVKTSGLGVACVTRFDVYEYDASGAYLRTTALTSLTGNSSAGGWQTMTATCTTGSSTAFCGLAGRVVDTNAGASANGTVWFDNVLIQDRAFTNTQNMAYCETRFPQSPAQPFVTGIQGTTHAPAASVVGSYLASAVGSNAAIKFYLGKRKTPTTSFVAVSPGTDANYSGTLDATVYGGYYTTIVQVGFSNLSTDFFLSLLHPNMKAQDIAGVYHALIRYMTKDSPTSDLNVELDAYFRTPDATYRSQAVVLGPSLTGPLAVASKWLPLDMGQFDLTLTGDPSLTDPSVIVGAEFDFTVNYTNSTGDRFNCVALIPVDGGVITGTFYDNLGQPVIVPGWFFSYMDGQRNNVPGWGWTQNAKPIVQTNRAVNAGGGAATVYSNLTLGADPFLQFNPTATIGNGTLGVAQMVAQIDDTSGQQTDMPLIVEHVYSPWSLDPR